MLDKLTATERCKYRYRVVSIVHHSHDNNSSNLSDYMFSLVPPTFSSTAGKRMDENQFGHKLKTLPMVHGSEQGLGKASDFYIPCS